MRRHNYEQFMEGTLIGLLDDCAYYCWQHQEITDEELAAIDFFTQSIYNSFKSNVSP